MKRILVPTDFSEHAEYALKVAAQIAKKNDGEIILVHMLELPHQENDAITHGLEIPEVMFFKNAVLRKMEELMDRDYLEDVKVSEIVQLDVAHQGIMKIGKNYDIDLIIMGSHGASGMKEMFVGSNAEKVVRNSEIPVLIIKDDKDTFNVDHFVFASDFSDEIKKPFARVVELANDFGATLHLLNINTPNNFKSTHTAQTIIDNFTKEFNIQNYQTHIYNDANIEAGVLNFANHVKADLVGMCTHGRKGLAHFLNGSVSESLVNHAHKPVITFKI